MKLTITKNWLTALLLFAGLGSWAQCDGLFAYFNYSISGDMVSFTNYSSESDAFTTYSWTYGEQTSTDENPTFVGEEELEMACLTMFVYTDSFITCTTTYCDTVYFESGSDTLGGGGDTLGGDPCEDLVASFSYYDDGSNVYVTNTSSGEGGASDYTWTYGSQTSTDENPVFEGEEGLDIICLTLVSYFDSLEVCTSTYCDSIYFVSDSLGGGGDTLVDDPCAALMADFVYTVDATNIYATNTSVGEGLITTYNWIYGSQSSTDENPTFIGEAGLEALCLVVVSSFDSTVCSDTYCESVYFMTDDSLDGDPCEDLYASFTYEVDGDDIYVTNTSLGEGDASDYSWTYGSQTSTDENPVFEGEEGLDIICLTLVSYFDSSEVCTSTYCDSIYFETDSTGTGDPCDEVEADFVFYTEGSSTYFVNYSSTGGGSASYEWTIGDETYYDENPIVDDVEIDSSLICLTITVFMEDSTICTDTNCKEFEVFDSSVLSLPTNGELEELVLYPNPATNQVTIQFGIDQEWDQIEIYNALGAIVYRENVLQGERQALIDISYLEQGLYVIRVLDSSSPEVNLSKRFMKK
ncbi:MAG: T9SS type A sorting domain-containing protein [Flavobacteriales bacterium]|nr:T9SS type A sorting domain-containing protein [Flavobacteriales bacterium]